MTVPQVALVILSLSLSVAAQYRGSRGHSVARIAGGAIAGIVIGCVVFLLLICLCCALVFRRRRRVGGAAPWRTSGQAPAAQEAGYGPGPGNQGRWNANAQPAYGGQYQPPPGPPSGAPQSGGFAPPPGPPPAAYTRKW
ncbi:hypothetical protein BD414DRAFT_527294 [Trametes punicea]|nr:hypothetical protein BD414DRAFT_527294 [Trametes punicea]